MCIIGTETLSADLRAGVYQCQLRTEGKPALEALLKLMTSTDLQEEKVRIIASLGSVREQELIQQVLELSMSAEIRSQDMDTCVAGCLATAQGMHALTYNNSTLNPRSSLLLLLASRVNICYLLHRK